MRRFLAAGIWLALTVTATVIVWTAVSYVAANVTERPGPVVPHQQVALALQAGSAQEAAPTTTTTTVAAHSRPPSSTLPSNPVGSPTTVSAPTTTTPTTVPVETPPTTAPTTATTKPAQPVTTTTALAPIVGGTAAYSTDGGIVGVGCTSFETIRLLAALPADGYRAAVFSGGPHYVAVDFLGNGRSIAVGSACVFGQPFEYTEGSGPPGPPSSS